MHRAARFIPTLLLAAGALACVSPITTASLSGERVPKGAGITLVVSQPDPVGMEHVLARALQQGGFEVFSAVSATTLTRPAGGTGDGDGETETLRKLKTRYLCRVRTYGWSTTIRSFTVQVLNVETGRVMYSMSGQDGSYAPSEIAEKLLAGL